MNKQKEKRKITWGKYTKGALGACQYSGWNQDGIIRFNLICQEVKEDREKTMIEELYKAHCIENVTPKKSKQVKGRETNAYVDDMSDLF